LAYHTRRLTILHYSSVVQGELDLLSIPTDKQTTSFGDPSSWSIDPAHGTIYNGHNPDQDAYYNLPAAAATRNVGGMSSHWTCCTPRQHPKLERSSIFSEREWELLYTEAEERIKTNSTLFNDSIRQQLVQRTLEGFHYGNGERKFIPMPLAAQKLPGQSYLEWSSSSTVFGTITQGPQNSANRLFTLRSQARCTLLHREQNPEFADYGKVIGAMCTDLKTDKVFFVTAKKYVLCAGAILTPGIMYNSGWKPESNELPALVSSPEDQCGF
jgi:pyranose oxidase